MHGADMSDPGVNSKAGEDIASCLAPHIISCCSAHHVIVLEQVAVTVCLLCFTLVRSTYSLALGDLITNFSDRSEKTYDSDGTLYSCCTGRNGVASCAGLCREPSVTQLICQITHRHGVATAKPCNGSFRYVICICEHWLAARYANVMPVVSISMPVQILSVASRKPGLRRGAFERDKISTKHFEHSSAVHGRTLGGTMLNASPLSHAFNGSRSPVLFVHHIHVCHGHNKFLVYTADVVLLDDQRHCMCSSDRNGWCSYSNFTGLACPATSRPGTCSEASQPG